SYFGYEMFSLRKNLDVKSSQQQQTASDLESTKLTLGELEEENERLRETLEELTEELENTLEDLEREQDKNDRFADQISDLSGTVATLDKLSKTDEELLQKYSKVYFLNENYIPSKIRQIEKDMTLAGKDIQYFHADALPFLEEMIEDAKDDGIDLKV